MAVSSLADLIEAHRRRWADSSTEDAVFGPIGAAEVAGWYERACPSGLGTSLRRALFFAASAGCVAGAELADGRLVVLKAFQRRWHLDYLRAASTAQLRLGAVGFPCPTQLWGFAIAAKVPPGRRVA